MSLSVLPLLTLSRSHTLTHTLLHSNTKTSPTAPAEDLQVCLPDTRCHIVLVHSLTVLNMADLFKCPRPPHDWLQYRTLKFKCGVHNYTELLHVHERQPLEIREFCSSIMSAIIFLQTLCERLYNVIKIMIIITIF